MNKITALLCMLLMCSASIYGQKGGGSIYSKYGLGEIKLIGSGQTRAMGFTSIGLATPYGINLTNPANNGIVGGRYNQTFDVSVNLQSTKFEAFNSSDTKANANLANLNYLFRFNRKLVSMIGFREYSSMGYNTSEIIGGTNKKFRGSGGLSKVYLSNSYSIHKNLQLGVDLSFIFGNLKNTVIGEGELQTEIHRSLTGFNATFGLNYEIKKEKFVVNFGAIYSPKTNLDGALNRTDYEIEGQLEASPNSPSQVQDELALNNYSTPANVGFGTSFTNKQFVLAADIEYTGWTKIDDTIFENKNITGINDTWRYSIGFEVTPDRRGNKYYERISYRLGAYSINSLLDVKDASFRTNGITGGLALPLKSGGTVNLSYQRKQNGSRTNGLYLESTHELTLNVTFRQLWFITAKYN